MSVIHIRREEELYNRFDPAQSRLSSDAYAYLKSLFAEMPQAERKSDVLTIECEGPIDREKAANAIRSAISRDIAEYDRQLSINKIKMLRLYVIGVALIVIGIVLALVLNQVLLEIISIVGSMAIKDASTIQIQNNPEIRLKKRLLERARDLKIEFSADAAGETPTDRLQA